MVAVLTGEVTDRPPHRSPTSARRDHDRGTQAAPGQSCRHRRRCASRLEFAISHIPGALNVAPKPGVAASIYVSDVAEIGRLLQGRKDTPLVLYCNGPHCGKSKRLAAELLDAGYTNVRRYQLGIPTWRAAGGVCAIELAGIRHVLAKDGTAVVIDAREGADFQKRTVRGARNIPRSLVLEGKDVGEVKRAKDDGRLPMEDHNTRIVVVGTDAAAAQTWPKP